MATLENPGERESLRRRLPVDDCEVLEKDGFLIRSSNLPYVNTDYQVSPSPSPSPYSEQKSDGSPGPKSPQKKVPDISELPQNVSKSRTLRFHKLFKCPPVEEYPIDTFSCAFKGDILLQGQMYVSHNWVCFYSKIRARGRLIEIPFSRIISITREKLALFIPNAIGIQTADQKYVFGSFIARDSTYKKLVTLAKFSQDASEVSSIPLGLTSNPSGLGHRRSGGGSSSSESTEDDDSNNDQLDLLLASSSHGHPHGPHGHTSKGKKLSASHGHGHRQMEVEVLRHSEPSASLMKPAKYCVDTKNVFKSFCAIPLKLHRIPRTNMLLAICSILVFFLMMSAVGLTYKILLLQSKMEVRAMWIPQVSADYRNRAMTNTYWLQTEKHASVVRQLHAVLEANIHLLEEVNVLLNSLHGHGHPHQPMSSASENRGKHDT